MTHSLARVDNEIKQNSKHISIALGVILFITLFIVSSLIRFLVIRRIQKQGQLMKLMAERRDLSMRLPRPKGNDEISTMADSFNSMISVFQEGMKEVSDATSSLIQGSQKIFSLTNDSKQAITEQSRKVSMTSELMQKLHKVVDEVSENATITKKSSHSANNEAEAGVKQVRNARDNINGLSEKIEVVGKNIDSIKKGSSEINRMLDMINEITVQTHYIAINSAVEAARAGEHGRGFVTVAEEIGELASRTKETTNEIKTIIDNFNNRIKEVVQNISETKGLASSGNELVYSSSQAFEKIAEEIRAVDKMSKSISSAAKDQQDAYVEINSNIEIVRELSLKTEEVAQAMAQIGQEFQQTASNLEQQLSQFII